MKIFNCGLPKTGTRSVHEALTQLGLRSIHCPVVGRGIRRWCRRSLFHPGRMPNELHEYDAFGDGPLWEITHELLTHLPTCKVLVTTREKEAWITSTLIHVLANRLQVTKGSWFRVNVRCLEERFDRAQTVYEDTQAEFSDRMLFLNPSEGDDWTSLCRFLDVPVPDLPFPHANSGWQKLQAMADILRPTSGAQHCEVTSADALNHLAEHAQ